MTDHEADTTGGGDDAPTYNQVALWLALTMMRFVWFPSREAVVTVVLWIFHCHLIDAFETTPRLLIVSPEPASGKTRLLELIGLLTPRPLPIFGATIAFLFHAINDPAGLPTVLVDEADTDIGRSGSEGLGALLNVGHHRGASIPRMGKGGAVEKWPVFAPVAAAGLGKFRHTLETRSIIIRMVRRLPDEHVESFRRRDQETRLFALRDLIASVAESIEETVRESRPDLPVGVEDRAADVWEPLIATADALGGDWPAWARRAAVTFVTDFSGTEHSVSLRLLADVRTAFHATEAKRIATKVLLASLIAMEDAPWASINGEPLGPRRLAQELSKYGVKSRVSRIDGDPVRAYHRADLEPVWLRYLPPTTPEGAAQPVQGTQSGSSASDVPETPDMKIEFGPAMQLPPFLGGADDSAALNLPDSHL
jgi:hypothetical protein